MGFQTRFESLKVHNRCQFARQAVPESGTGVRECSHSYLETKGRQFTLAARWWRKSSAVGHVRCRRESVDYVARNATDVGDVHHRAQLKDNPVPYCLLDVQSCLKIAAHCPTLICFFLVYNHYSVTVYMLN